MDYEVSANNIQLKSSFDVSKKDFERELATIRERHPDSLVWNRSMDLKGTLGDAINTSKVTYYTLVEAAAYNMRHWTNKNALSSFVSWLKTLVGRLENVLFVNENKNACLR